MARHLQPEYRDSLHSHLVNDARGIEAPAPSVKTDLEGISLRELETASALRALVARYQYLTPEKRRGGRSFAATAIAAPNVQAVTTNGRVTADAVAPTATDTGYKLESCKFALYVVQRMGDPELNVFETTWTVHVFAVRQWLPPCRCACKMKPAHLLGEYEVSYIVLGEWWHEFAPLRLCVIFQSREQLQNTLAARLSQKAL